MMRFRIISMAWCMFFSAQIVLACSCAFSDDPIESFKASDAVFSGQVLDIQSENYVNAVRMQVNDAFKGVNAGEITVYTNRDGKACGYDFAVGETYFIYADKNSPVTEMKGGKLSVSKCSSTKLLAEAGEDIAAIQKVLQLKSTDIDQKVVPGPVPDNIVCSFVTDCAWVSGWPEKLGGCGCFNTGYILAMEGDLASGYYASEPFVECDGPPWPDTACLCVKGACQTDLATTQYNAGIIPRSQALDIAKKRVLQEEGYEWKDVSIEDAGDAWLIRTATLHRGGNATIRIDKATGEILETFFNPR